MSGELLRHFVAALSLLRVPSVASLIADSGSLEKETRSLALFLSQFAQAYPLLDTCRNENAVLAAFLAAPPGPGKTAGLAASAHRLSDALFRLREATIVVNNPFQQGMRDRCLFDQLAGRRPDPTNPAEVQLFGAAAVARFSELYLQALGRLAQIAETVEAALSRDLNDIAGSV